MGDAAMQPLARDRFGGRDHRAQDRDQIVPVDLCGELSGHGDAEAARCWRATLRDSPVQCNVP